MARRQSVKPAAGGPVPTAAVDALASELSAVLASCNERLLDLHRQASELAFAEASAVQAAWLNAATAITQLLPRQSDRANAMRSIEIVSAWLQVITQTQTALIGLMEQAALAGNRAPPGSPARTGMADRRKLAVVISFPDRRRIA